MNVVDAVGELIDERGGIEELVREMARVEIDPEALPALDRVKRLSSRHEVVRDFGRMNLEPVADSL